MIRVIAMGEKGFIGKILEKFDKKLESKSKKCGGCCGCDCEEESK